VIHMSTENEVSEAAEVPENTEETSKTEEALVAEKTSEAAEAAEAETKQEEDEREKLQWPGANGDGEMRLNFFDMVGLPETLEDEPDPTRRIILALIAELQQLRIENNDLKAAVQYMTLETFIQRSGRGGASPNRPMPMAMNRIAGAK